MLTGSSPIFAAADVPAIRRTPTVDEYRSVVGSDFYKGDVAVDVYERMYAGVVALKSNGEVIGTVRIMLDAPGWYSIWDVPVLPDWQGQRIGTTMMEKALDIVREASPGAFVYLFTYKHEFYERLGFSKESVDIVKV